MDAAGKFFIDAGLNEGWNILRRFRHSTAEGVVPRHGSTPFATPTVLSCDRCGGCRIDFETLL